jgi:DNA-directed RNA polymerase specialized sigma24 family protein
MPTPTVTRSGRKGLPVPGSVPNTTAQSLTLDSSAVMDLYEWLNRRRFSLFGDLRRWDQQDAIQEAFIRTLDFAGRMLDHGAIYGACYTIALRVRAQRIADIAEYIQERCSPPGVVPLVQWHPECRLFERDRRTGTLLAIRSLPVTDQEILLRFYFKEQTPKQIQLEMHLTATQFRLRKSRAISRVRLRASAILADVRSRTRSGNGAG